MASLSRVIHTRDDLLAVIGTKASHRRAVIRSLCEGSVEVLGGFKHIPPSDYPGWCVLLTSPITRQVYKVGVTIEPGCIYRVWSLDDYDIPWSEWSGGNDAFVNNPLMSGDHPDRYKEYKNAASSPSEETKTTIKGNTKADVAEDV